MSAQPMQYSSGIEPFPGSSRHDIRQIPLRQGLELMMGDHRVVQPEKITFETSAASCDLVFVLSGSVRNWIDGFAKPNTVRSPSTALWLTPRLAGSCEYLPGSDIRYVGVSIDRMLLADMAGDYLQQAPNEFRRILEGRQHALYYRFDAATVPMRSAAQQLFQCPYRGSMKNLFLEGKALELISHLMAHHFGEHPGAKGVLPERDIKVIKRARDYLIESMEAPPSIPELARYLGINESKLTRNFRKVFGTSVFAYLRDRRIEKARAMLESGNMSVTEVACAVGYSSLSHFTRVFARHCGINPQRYLHGFRHRT